MYKIFLFMDYGLRDPLNVVEETLSIKRCT
jgi:hypothetical protein